MTLAGRLARSPALRFLALGVALHLVESIARHPPDRSITAPPAVVRALRDELRARLGRVPTADELRARAEVWADDERLSREAIERRLWESDPVLRQRLVERARWVLRGEAMPDRAPTPDELAGTLARHPDRYAVPPRVSFTQVFVSRALHPDPAAAMAALGPALDRGDPIDALGDPAPFGRVAVAQGAASLASAYGDAFADALRELPTGVWSPPLATRYGLHRVRITARSAPATLTVAQAGERLVADWRDDQRDARDALARRDLRRRRPLRLDDP